jgi:uncharacterized protein (TIGR00266 family)
MEVRMEANVRGTVMPVLEVTLNPGESIVAESGELSWLSDSIELSTSTALAGSDGVFDSVKRAFGGGSFFMTQYSATSGPGTVVFAAKVPGKIFTVPLGEGKQYIIRQHGFMAGTFGAELETAFHPRKVGSGLFGGFGFILQRVSGAGHAWIELSGEIFQYDLQAGQTMRVHPGHIGMLDSTVTYELTTVPGIKNMIFGSDGIFLMRLTGPGRIWLQSMPLPVLANALAPYLPQGGQTAGVSLGTGSGSQSAGVDALKLAGDIAGNLLK